MDKQKFLGLLATIMIAAVAAFNVNLNSQEETLSDLAMENVEALASEQPDTSDCISDPNYDCEALHPTDPSKDKLRENARW